MNLNPVPIAWEETLDGLKQGLVDGAETWSSATAFANMGPVVRRTWPSSSSPETTFRG